jgi:hypothetical protein
MKKTCGEDDRKKDEESFGHDLSGEISTLHGMDGGASRNSSLFRFLGNR